MKKLQSFDERAHEYIRRTYESVGVTPPEPDDTTPPPSDTEPPETPIPEPPVSSHRRSKEEIEALVDKACVERVRDPLASDAEIARRYDLRGCQLTGSTQYKAVKARVSEDYKPPQPRERPDRRQQLYVNARINVSAARRWPASAPSLRNKRSGKSLPVD
jgi:hypothetical protein